MTRCRRSSRHRAPRVNHQAAGAGAAKARNISGGRLGGLTPVAARLCAAHSSYPALTGRGTTAQL